MTEETAVEQTETEDAAVEPVDPEKAQQTLSDLIALDHELRDHGSSVAAVLRDHARRSAGIRLS